MFGLGLLALGMLKAAVGIGNIIEDEEMKASSYTYTDKGESMWFDARGNTYINGEKIIFESAYREDGSGYMRRVGVNTGRVYYDPEKEKKDKRRLDDKKNKEEAIKNGKLAYLKWHPQFNEQVTCEISTGKYIAGLVKYNEIEASKIYIDPNSGISCGTKPGDYGIKITVEEFYKLDVIGGSHFVRY